jgi:hypothetical protein
MSMSEANTPVSQGPRFKAYKESRGTAPLILNVDTGSGERSASRFGVCNTEERARFPLNRRLRGSEEQFFVPAGNGNPDCSIRSLVPIPSTLFRIHMCAFM